MIRQIIIRKLNEIKSKEDNFESKWWKMNFFGDSSGRTEHISKLDFNRLDDEDLVRCFEWIIKDGEDVLTKRINEDYFQ